MIHDEIRINPVFFHDLVKSDTTDARCFGAPFYISVILLQQASKIGDGERSKNLFSFLVV